MSENKKVDKASTKKIKLSVADRLNILAVVPRKGNIVILTVAKDITDKVNLSQKDMKELEFKNVEGQFFWDKKKDKGLMVNFTELEYQTLKNELKTLSEKNDLEISMVDLYKKIVE